MAPDEPVSTDLSHAISVFREFNRMYTRFIGTLSEKLLSSKFNLTEARVLYELANRASPKAAEIAADLEVDPAYLSRILARFQRRGLLKRVSSEDDGRAVHLTLTARGKSSFGELNAQSNSQAESVLNGLAPTARDELVRCMRRMEDILLKDRRQAPLVLRTHRVGDMGWVVHREAVGYATQFGWDASFEELVARIVADFLAKFDPARDRCWIAELDGHSVGHIFLVRHPDQPGTAKLRLLFVEPGARGLGVGESLVRECLSFARSAGYKKVVLWTQSILTAAHRIYQKAGFRLVKEEPHRSFGHDLVGQEWELEL